jgi:hypothetical protein
MERFFVEVLKLSVAGDRRHYLPTGEAGEVEARNEWEAGRMFFARLGRLSLPRPAFALRIRKLTISSALAASA